MKSSARVVSDRNTRRKRSIRTAFFNRLLESATHSTAHSDGILTRTEAHAGRFVDEVDSAAVYVNASTRFTDGAQLGLGAEVAVSTQRLHARGPMALRELTTYKWIIIGDNHVRP